MNEHFLIQDHKTHEERGPFTISQLESLVVANQLTPKTLYLDDTTNEWIPFGKNDGLMTILFPEKKRLRIRQHQEHTELKKNTHSNQPKKQLSESADAIVKHLEEASSLVYYKKIQLIEPALLGLIFLISSVGLLYPFAQQLWSVFFYNQFEVILSDITMTLGIFDFLLGILFFFGGTLVYKIAWYRGLIGLGFFCYLYWVINDSELMYTSFISNIGIVGCTYVLSRHMLWCFTLLAFAGTSLFAVYSII